MRPRCTCHAVVSLGMFQGQDPFLFAGLAGAFSVLQETLP